MKTFLFICMLLVSSTAYSADFSAFSMGTTAADYIDQTLIIDGRCVKIVSATDSVSWYGFNGNDFRRWVLSPGFGIQEADIDVYEIKILYDFQYDPSDDTFYGTMNVLMVQVVDVPPDDGYYLPSYQYDTFFLDLADDNTGGSFSTFPTQGELAILRRVSQEKDILLYLNKKVANMEPQVITQSISFLIGAFLSVAFVIAVRRF